MRLVDITSTRYAIARRYMIRLRRDDYRRPARGGQARHDGPAERRGFPPSIRVSRRGRAAAARHGPEGRAHGDVRGLVTRHRAGSNRRWHPASLARRSRVVAGGEGGSRISRVWTPVTREVSHASHDRVGRRHRAPVDRLPCRARAVGHGRPQPPTRTIYVSATDRNGASVLDLAGPDFAVKEGGKVREVVQAGPATRPMKIAIVDRRQRHRASSATGSGGSFNACTGAPSSR